MTNTETKKCPRCEEVLPVDSFGIKVRRTGQLQAYCKPCTRANSKAHYNANKPSYRAKKLRYRLEAEDYIRDLKESTPCVDCGVSYRFYVMHFDHLPQFTKVASISKMQRNAGSPSDLEKIRSEIAKCEIVCGNCHAERTYTRLCLRGSTGQSA